jgi:electron transport complex protein RnfB
MATDVYERLADFLDRMPAGYPRTESGIELRILRRLFTPEEAELTLHLTLLTEESRVVARRARLPVAEVAQRLAEMTKKGLIFPVYTPGKPTQYMAQQFAVGFYEGQVNHLTPELVHDLEEYWPAFNEAEFWRKAPQLRTIPVGQSIEAPLEVLPYERAEELVRRQTTFAVANCVCRQEQDLVGHHCTKPRETCMIFGMGADFYVRTGHGRAISMEETLGILALAEETGLVLQPGYAKDAMNICACCGCCCGVLRMVKMTPEPASVAVSAFRASLDAEQCNGCATCEDRCQMAAITVNGGGKAALDLRCCIGCGLCVSTCPTGALSLVRKPEAEQRKLPATTVQSYIEWGKTRGTISTPSLIGLVVQSKLDRMLARQPSPIVD